MSHEMKFKQTDVGRQVWVICPFTHEEVEGTLTRVGLAACAGSCEVVIHEEEEAISGELRMWYPNGQIRRRPGTIRRASC